MNGFKTIFVFKNTVIAIHIQFVIKLEMTAVFKRLI